MFLKNNRNIEIEAGQNSKIDLSLFRKKGNSKTFKGYMLQKMKEARKENNFEVVELIQHFYKKYLEFEKFESKQVIEIEIIEGWKGLDSIEMFKGFTEDFIIKSHQKDKETGEVISHNHTISFENVNRILWMIKALKKDEKINYRQIVPKIIKSYDLQIGLDAFNGGKNRAKYYFPLYYYPLKILESLEFIDYSGRGTTTRIK